MRVWFVYSFQTCIFAPQNVEIELGSPYYDQKIRSLSSARGTVRGNVATYNFGRNSNDEIGIFVVGLARPGCLTCRDTTIVSFSSFSCVSRSAPGSNHVAVMSEWTRIDELASPQRGSAGGSPLPTHFVLFCALSSGKFGLAATVGTGHHADPPRLAWSGAPTSGT